MQLKGKTALVTGATSGIGLATVERFVKEGAQVVFCGRREERGKEIERRLRSEGGDVCYVRTDVSVDADLENLVKVTIDTYSKIDILVNNAGMTIYSPFEDVDMVNDFDLTMRTNVRAYFYTCKLVLPHMKKMGRGSIINISSLAGLSGGPTLTTYTTSKAAVNNMTRSLAKALGGYGIRVNCICPGLIYTEMTDKANLVRGSETEMAFSQQIPLGRGGEAHELANAVTFLAGEEASYLSGVIMPVDGGFSA